MVSKLKCKHCGKDYEDKYSSCPFCAEPKEIIDNSENNYDYYVAIISHCIAIPVGVFVGTFVLFFFSMFLFALIPAAIFSIISLILVIVYHKYKPKNREIIEKQFYRDKTSICPMCGSHSISLGRKGYDWDKGFWYRMFNVKGGHYLAGGDSRRVTAYCQNCGHHWLTDRQWIR